MSDINMIDFEKDYVNESQVVLDWSEKLPRLEMPNDYVGMNDGLNAYADSNARDSVFVLRDTSVVRSAIEVVNARDDIDMTLTCFKEIMNHPRWPLLSHAIDSHILRNIVNDALGVYYTKDMFATLMIEAGFDYDYVRLEKHGSAVQVSYITETLVFYVAYESPLFDVNLGGLNSSIRRQRKHDRLIKAHFGYDHHDSE